jgi:hypothetical protein
MMLYVVGFTAAEPDAEAGEQLSLHLGLVVASPRSLELPQVGDTGQEDLIVIRQCD